MPGGARDSVRAAVCSRGRRFPLSPRAFGVDLDSSQVIKLSKHPGRGGIASHASRTGARTRALARSRTRTCTRTRMRTQRKCTRK